MHVETINKKVKNALLRVLQASKEAIELYIEDTLSDPESYHEVLTPNGTITDLKPDIEDEIDCLEDILEYLKEDRISEAIELALENGFQDIFPDWIVKLYSTLTRFKKVKVEEPSPIPETIDEIDDIEF
jgi:predicted RNase H-like HicB family nuclease